MTHNEEIDDEKVDEAVIKDITVIALNEDDGILFLIIITVRDKTPTFYLLALTKVIEMERKNICKYNLNNGITSLFLFYI